MNIKNGAILLILSLSIATHVVMANQPSKKLYVQVKKSALRSEPKFWAPVLKKLTYADELTPVAALSADKDWIEVKFEDTTGFAHITAVTTRQLSLKASTKVINQKVDGLTVSFAGKGFNKNVEQKYSSSKGVSFTSVDTLEEYSIEPGRLHTFIQEGKLDAQ